MPVILRVRYIAGLLESTDDAIDGSTNESGVPPPQEYMMPYPEELIAPMRQDLVQLGIKELRIFYNDIGMIE